MFLESSHVALGRGCLTFERFSGFWVQKDEACTQGDQPDLVYNQGTHYEGS